ncbi:FecR family protein [Chitinophaga sp.]|uniref:FecR family protein n=1 Tax=Chitinophaga sp. TaxID=1869181 RepID=UPI002F951E3D
METPGKDINWDKLLSALENGGTEPLNEEEAAMLRAAEEMKVRVKKDNKFPADAGWEQFVAARENRKMKVIWRRRIAVAAAAAALLITAGVWSWQKHKPGATVVAINKADLPAAGQVQLVLSNGKTITLGNNAAVTQNNNGTQIQVDSTGIVYLSEGEGRKQPVNAMDILYVPRGKKIRIELSDGTGVWVNADSKLVYPSAFAGNTREVWIQGEAYFEVAPNAQQAFVVHAGSANVQVLGTAFNISTYEDIQTTLINGKVSASAGNEKVVLSPGEQASYDAATASLQKESVDTRIYTAWKDDDIYFEDVTLGAILNSLGRSFDYNFKFEDATLEKLNITLDMHKPETLQPALDHIRLTIGNIKFVVQGRTVTVGRP